MMKVTRLAVTAVVVLSMASHSYGRDLEPDNDTPAGSCYLGDFRNVPFYRTVRGRIRWRTDDVQDYYKFTVHQTMAPRIYLDFCQSNLFVELYDQNLQLMAVARCFGAGTESRILRLLKPGLYYIRVRGFSTPSGYVLWINNRAPIPRRVQTRLRIAFQILHRSRQLRTNVSPFIR